MTRDKSITIAMNLLTALYATPQHGPAVVSVLPSGKMLPDLSTGAIYAEMIQFGLATGVLDYALLDAQISRRDAKIYERLIDESRFMLSQRTHEKDPTMMVAWAEMLGEKYRNQEIGKDLAALIRLAEEGEESTEDLVARVMSTVRGYVEDGSAKGGSINHIRKACSQALERVQDWRDGISSDSLLTGFPSIDSILGGLPISEMSVMAGMTSGFKTASLIELMRRISLRFEKKEDKQAVVIFSAEMSAEKLAHRLASNISGISQGLLRPSSGKASVRDEDFARYEHAISRASGLEIYVNDEPNPSYETMYAQCLSIQSRMPISFVGFDYLEKMEASGDSEELRVSAVAQSLKKLAKALAVPVLTLSQYSRKADTYAGSVPSNGWLRYSGKIEHEAAVIIHWYYPQYFVNRGHDAGGIEMYDPMERDKIYAICTKNRDGRTANIAMKVNEETGQFTDPMESRFGENLSPVGSEEAPF